MDSMCKMQPVCMLGKHQGVATSLKKDVPHVVEVHCVTHRLELGILDALKEEKQLKDVKETLQGLYKHYHYSAKALREVAETLEITVLKPINVMGTRWVSRALTVLLRNMRHITLFTPQRRAAQVLPCREGLVTSHASCRT